MGGIWEVRVFTYELPSIFPRYSMDVGPDVSSLLETILRTILNYYKRSLCPPLRVSQNKGPECRTLSYNPYHRHPKKCYPPNSAKSYIYISQATPKKSKGPCSILLKAPLLQKSLHLCFGIPKRGVRVWGVGLKFKVLGTHT